MRVKTIPSDWMDKNGLRLDSGPYLAGAFEAQIILERLGASKLPLYKVTKGYKGGIYNGPQFSRNYVEDPAYGVPFITGSSMLQADLTNVGLLSRHDANSSRLNYLELHEGMTLISCSGTIGRMTYCRSDFDGMWSSQDVLKVVPDTEQIKPGYLYAFLSSRFGVPQIIGGTYGAVIQHIEPEHIFDLQVPRLGGVEDDAHKFVTQAAKLRSQYQYQIREATRLYFESIGLQDISAHEWHNQGASLGFAATLAVSTSLRALNFNPRFNTLVKKLSSVKHKLLGEICSDGELGGGARFKRVDAEPEYGIKLIGQKEIFWLEPEGRWISPKYAPEDIFVKDETILVASQGTLGENEVFCRASLITGDWIKFAYTQHFLRIYPGTSSEFSGALLFAFLRSETAFRCLRSMSTGSKQQDLHHELLKQFPIPVPGGNVTATIEGLVRTAFQARHEAARLEHAAIALVENTIQEST